MNSSNQERELCEDISGGVGFSPTPHWFAGSSPVVCGCLGCLDLGRIVFYTQSGLDFGGAGVC